jgi:hypothetical protein
MLDIYDIFKRLIQVGCSDTFSKALQSHTLLRQLRWLYRRLQVQWLSDDLSYAFLQI